MILTMLIANENTAKWTTEVDDTIHSKMYNLATDSGLLLGGSELLDKNVRIFIIKLRKQQAWNTVNDIQDMMMVQEMLYRY